MTLELHDFDLPGYVILFLILFARIGALLMTLPLFSDDAVPGRIRLLIALGLTAGLFGLLSPSLPAPPDGQAAVAVLLFTEMLIGLAIGVLVRIMFLAVAMAGGLMSLQVGLTSALVSDASLGGQVPVLSRFIGIAALVVCTATGVHHLWIGALVHSYAIFPVGSLPPAHDLAQLAVATVTRATVLGLGLAAPLMVYGLIFNVALGLAARLTPAIQIFFIAQPLNLLAGLTLFAALLASTLFGFAHEMANWTMTIWG